MSPRARGRVQVALPTDGENSITDYDKISKNNANVPIQADMSIKKEFALTGNFPPRPKKNLGLSSRDEKRQTVYKNGQHSPQKGINHHPIGERTQFANAMMNQTDYGRFDISQK